MKLKNSILFLFIFAIVLSCIYPALSRTAYGPQIDKDGYTVSRSLIDRDIKFGNVFKEEITITNKKDNTLTVSVKSSESLSKVLRTDSAGVVIKGQNESDIFVVITGKEPGNYFGEIELYGDISEKIPVNITVLNNSIASSYVITLKTEKNEISINDPIDFTVDIEKIIAEDPAKNLTFNYSLVNLNTNESYSLGSEIQAGVNSFQIRKSFELPKGILEGYYNIVVLASEDDKITVSQSGIDIKRPLLQLSVFGVPLWIILLVVGFIIILIISYIMVKRAIEKKRKYKMVLYEDTLPKKSPDVIFLGKVAERNISAYYDINNLTTHAVVAGATGGGKSISSQVIVEEALLKNIAVVVFDPTAQWSGMLRKCEDKKMISLYPKFGLKASNARAFPGNVKQIKNARQAIDIKKYINPGQIQIFAMNKLDPADIDIFVESAIVSIFRSSPEEHPVLRVLLVFDEVHRLLPKFGGTGKGFLQIERACREFRKWGFGVMLVSQVLSDFVGEIKANINTELQMRTRDESDLNRLKTKYGEEFLQSLIKASVGVGMMVNPAYNKGKPYFIQFRPILHNTRRLSDDILEKYNAYGEVIEDLDYQIEQLEKEKVDTFDLKMELKLVKDKLMSGNFTVVDIYLEGLKPRMEKQWKTLGKTPKKKELELLQEKDVAEQLKAASTEREKWEKEHGAEKGAVEAKKEENKILKIVKPITFDNGAMISSLSELKDVLPTLENDIFKVHVNDDKNEIADWVSKEIDSGLGSKLKPLKDKKAMLDQIDLFIKESSPKKEDKK